MTPASSSSTLPIPRPSLSTLDQTRRFLKDPFQLIDDAREECGDIFALRILGLGDWVLLGSPELVRQMFKAPPDTLAAGEFNASTLGFLLGLDTTFSLDGDAHLERRRLVHPQLNGRRVLCHVDLMRETTRRAMKAWPRGTPFPFLPVAHRLSLDILATAMLGPARPERTRELADLFDDFATRGLRSPLIPMSFLQWDLGPWSPWGKVLRMSRAVHTAFSDEISHRLEAGELGDDTIIGALASSAETSGHGLPHEILLQEILTLLFAGHETTGAILTWTLECLLAHPEVLQRVQAEITHVAGSGPIEADHLSRLPYLEAVINESIRHRPIAPMAGLRRAKKPFHLAGYLVQEGKIVTQCFPLMCRRPELFENPESFDPNHFYERKLKPFEWNPFGGGVRMCTGKGFAEVELKVVLATLLQNAAFRLCQEQVRPVRHGFFFGPSQGLRIAVESAHRTT